MLIGDIVWHKMALDLNVQKGTYAAGLGHPEDRAALAEQIQWLRELRGDGLHVVIAHDWQALELQIAEGVIRHGLYLDR